MRKTHPINDWLFLILVVTLSLIVLFSFASFVRAEPDTDSGILDSMVGYKVRDFDYNTIYTVTPSPTGGYVVRDPKYHYPLYKVEGGKIYNYKREPILSIMGIGNEKGKAVP